MLFVIVTKDELVKLQAENDVLRKELFQEQSKGREVEVKLARYMAEVDRLKEKLRVVGVA